MVSQGDPLDQPPSSWAADFEQPTIPPPVLPVPPHDMRGRLPPFLYDWLTRFGSAFARNWWALDRTGRLFVACLAALSLCFALLAIAGWFRKAGDDAHIAGYSGQQPPKPVTVATVNVPPVAPGPAKHDSEIVNRHDYLQGCLDGGNASVDVMEKNGRLSKDEAAAIKKSLLKNLSKMSDTPITTLERRTDIP